MNIATDVLSGETITGTDWGNFTASDITPVDPRTSEDCLFLDLLVPETTFSNKDTENRSPVLLFIHGGGFVQASKAAYGYGDGLLESDFLKNHRDIIYISINYRLGLFVREIKFPAFEAFICESCLHSMDRVGLQARKTLLQISACSTNVLRYSGYDSISIYSVVTQIMSPSWVNPLEVALS